jgi:hypothetical protein
MQVVRTKILATLVAAGLAPSPALAVDWSMRSTASETVEANDNQFLRVNPAASLGSYSTITTNAEARTPTSKFDFDSEVNYRKYWGPGAEGSSLAESRSDTFKARYEAYGKDATDKNYLEASWNEQSAAFALLNEFGVQTGAIGMLDTATFSGGIERQLTFADFVTLSARSSLVSNDPPTGGTSFSDTTATATWRHRASATLALLASSEIEWLNYNNALNTGVTILRDTAGLDVELSPLLSFRGSAGIGVVMTERGSTGATAVGPFATGGSSTGSSSAPDWVADFLLTYKMLKSTTFTLSGSQTIAPSVVGSLFKRDTVRAGLVHVLNSRTTLSLSADATRSIGAGSTSDYLSGSLSWNYLLARDWSANVSYRYLHVIPGSTPGLGVDPITGIPVAAFLTAGPVSSNSFTVVVSHEITVLPRGQ